MINKILVIGLWVVAIGLGIRDYQLLKPTIPQPYRSLYQVARGDPEETLQTRLRREVLAPVVKVTTPQGTGSGVVIRTIPDGQGLPSGADTYILTAAHVVGNNNEVQVYIYDYESLPDKSGNYSSCLIYEANVVMTDTAKDLALLRVLCASAVTAKLAPRNYKPYLFTLVYAVGCSLGLNPRPSEGIITAVPPDVIARNGATWQSQEIASPSARNDGLRCWEISAPVLPGNSGGGVFLKDTHELIGITVWVRVYQDQMITTMVGVVPLQDIYNFLEEAKKIKSLKAQESRSQTFNPLSFETVNQRVSAGRCPDASGPRLRNRCS